MSAKIESLIMIGDTPWSVIIFELQMQQTNVPLNALHWLAKAAHSIIHVS